MKRLQRQRTKDWRMPAGAVYVGRPSAWGNPYRVGEIEDWLAFDRDTGRSTGEWTETVVTSERAVELYRAMLDEQLAYRPDYLASLRGKDLVCWCPLDQPCHADVLLELAA